MKNAILIQSEGMYPMPGAKGSEPLLCKCNNFNSTAGSRETVTDDTFALSFTFHLGNLEFELTNIF